MTFTIRCSFCKTSEVVQTTLNEARLMQCPICRSRMTVAGHQEDGVTVPGEPAPVTKPPAIEKANWRNTDEQDEDARRLLMVAFGEV